MLKIAFNTSYLPPALTLQINSPHEPSIPQLLGFYGVKCAGMSGWGMTTVVMNGTQCGIKTVVRRICT